ncbi:MAG: hypothetical protein IKG77_01960 [Prevotella sp.]|nr:hypothetical protein [Prevotella sp.]
MKTFKLFSMAALALAMAACSNEDNELENVIPAQQGTMHFTATIAAPGSGATTRTTYTEITSGVDAGKIKVAWNVGDKIALVHNGVVDEAEVTTVDDVTGSATIDADITGKPSDNDAVVLVYPADYVGPVLSGTNFLPNPAVEGKVLNQGGTREYIQNNLDIRGCTSQLAVSGSGATLKTSVEMSSGIVIWKLTLTTDGSTPLPATEVTVKNGSDVLAAMTTISPTSEVYLALLDIPVPSYKNLTIEATVGSDTYTYIAPGPVSVTEGNYYQSTVTMKTKKTTDLSTITTDYEAQDYEVLTGTLGSNVKISIADGAKVTLKDVTINGSGTWEDGDYAGITCEGDATIILEGTNTVKGFANKYPGICVSSGKTIVIKGTGELNASSNGTYNTGSGGAGIGGGNKIDCGNIEIQSGTVTATGNRYGAGIGGGFNADCGNITISGGIVTATGGYYAAGIGGGRRGPSTGSCGNITISGGTITATGGEDAAGIGGGRGINSGYTSSCGKITITSGVTSVTATKGSGTDNNSIGAGHFGTCGAVTIDGTEYPGGISDSHYTYEP